ncbi:acyl-CoA acyltransferase [Bradyrhizobium sp. dw_411]|uniref:acyl-CoA acyltransferase n=1 Tax=Bradyrhizobium sp. dw_411 TaxID=2720082 RepID=UPI001BCFE113|nr:acyl-CoA acyltransferase [Bradyrhizobium sp. dw_411]
MPAAKPRFREIQAGDLDAIGDLLTRGFQYRSRDYWMRGLRRQGTRPLPPGEPRYGYLIENNGAPVGCLLTIYSSKTIDGETATCCNVSSWYVDPEFRNYAALFASMTQKRKDVTYLNVTPAVATWPILEAQGFKAYCRGFYFSLPVLARGGRGMTIEAVTAATASVEGLPDEDLEMLKRHAEYGCLALVCRTAQATLPFIFFPLRKRRGIIPLPALQLGYCRSIADYIDCAGAIGRYLLWRGKPVVVVDATGPLAGLPGIYCDLSRRKYYKGPHEPRLGDLADTELAIFGM